MVAGAFETSYIPPIFAKREELKEKHTEKIQRSSFAFIEKPLSGEEIIQRQEIIDLNPKVVKVLCNAGKNRSAFVANILNEMGYEADNSGVGGSSPFTEEDFKDDYDAIIFVTEDVKKMFEIRAQEHGLLDRLNKIPSRTLGFAETGIFYLNEDQKSTELDLIKPKIVGALDKLGFIKKTDHI